MLLFCVIVLWVILGMLALLGIKTVENYHSQRIVLFLASIDTVLAIVLTVIWIIIIL